MFHLNRGIRRGLAFGLSLAMAVTMLPVNGAKASEKKTASDPVRQEENGISDGTYLVPVSGLKKPLAKSTGTVWGNDTSTGIGMQLDRYATVEVKDGTYKTSFTLYGGSEMESLQIADEAASSDPETFNETVLRSDLLEQDGVSEEGITALEAAGVATDGAINAANVAETVKTTKAQGKAQFTFTDSVKRSQVGILAMSCLYSNNNKQYKKACFTSAAATLDWADAVKVNEESGKWSVQTTSVGASVNSVGWDEEQSAFVQKFNAIFDKADVVKKDGKLQATIHIQKYGKEEYQVASIDKYDDEPALTRTNFTMLSSTHLSNAPLEITDSSFTVDFENPYDIIYLMSAD